MSQDILLGPESDMPGYLLAAAVKEYLRRHKRDLVLRGDVGVVANVSEREVQLVAVLRYQSPPGPASLLLHGTQVAAPNSATVGFPLLSASSSGVAPTHPLLSPVPSLLEQATDSMSEAIRQANRMTTYASFRSSHSDYATPIPANRSTISSLVEHPQFVPPLPRCCRSTPASARA